MTYNLGTNLILIGDRDIASLSPYCFRRRFYSNQYAYYKIRCIPVDLGGSPGVDNYHRHKRCSGYGVDRNRCYVAFFVFCSWSVCGGDFVFYLCSRCFFAWRVYLSCFYWCRSISLLVSIVSFYADWEDDSEEIYRSIALWCDTEFPPLANQSRSKPSLHRIFGDPGKLM